MTRVPRAAARVLREVSRSFDLLGLDAGVTVVVGFSGGPDSLCLLWALSTLRRLGQGPCPVAVHVDHQLRVDSARDAAQAVALAHGLGVALEVEQVDVTVWPEYRLEGTEAAARAARYAALGRAALRHQAAAIAIGHTRDDQAETVLLRLLRGASLEGLAGMRPVSRRRVRLDPADHVGTECTVVRPLLGLGRAEVHACLSCLGLTPLEDPSNREPQYRRNRIRHQVIPLLEEIAPGSTHVIARVATLLQDDADYLEDQASRYVGELVRCEGSVCRIDRVRLALLPAALQRRVLLTSMLRASRDRWHPPAERLEALRMAANRASVGRRIELGNGWLALVEYDAVAIGRSAELETVLRLSSGLPLLKPGARVELGDRAEIPLGNGWRLSCQHRVPGRWVLRTRRPGDRLIPESGRPPIRLQDWLVNRKVPAYLRDWLPLLADDGTVWWVAGVMGTSFDHPHSLIQVELVRQPSGHGVASDEERGCGWHRSDDWQSSSVSIGC